ncbi:MAG: hypothetical protein PHP53_24615 [Prolixibacteraceae bacterium]|jgi:hypothetical protein|nr:hypothetical protein [Prolixibacteraceae bacterium]
MSEKNYKIVVNSELENFIPNLFNDYWDFLDFSNLKYRYTSSAIQEKYGLTASVYYKAVRSSGYLEFKELMDCGKCYANIKVYNRNEVFHLIKKRSHSELFCKTCYSIKFNDSCKMLVNKFSESLPLELIVENKSNEYSLSYLEKIFLYNLITQSDSPEGEYIEEHVWENFLALEAIGLEDIVKSIFDKGYVYNKKYDDCLLEQQVYIKKLYYRNAEEYSDEDTFKNLKLIANLDLSSYFCLNIPELYSNVSSWAHALYTEIANAKLTIFDCKEIEAYLKTKRLMEVYELLDYTCSYWNVPIVKDNALEFELLRMIINYDLNCCFAIIYYQAKETGAFLNKMGSEVTNQQRFTKNHLLRMRVSSYMDYLERKNEKPKHPRPLPLDWVTSEIELFVSMNIIKGYQKWEKYTPEEITSEWLAALDIDA